MKRGITKIPPPIPVVVEMIPAIKKQTAVTSHFIFPRFKALSVGNSAGDDLKNVKIDEAISTKEKSLLSWIAGRAAVTLVPQKTPINMMIVSGIMILYWG